jgi:hypothetical protein
MLTLTKVFDKNVYIYHTKYIGYESIYHEESSSNDLVFFLPTYLLVKLYIV